MKLKLTKSQLREIIKEVVDEELIKISAPNKLPNQRPISDRKEKTKLDLKRDRL